MLLGFANDHVIALRAGNRAVDQQQVVRFAHLDDFQILRGALDLAHVTGHPHAAHDRAGEQTLTDCAGATMPAFGTVRGITTAEIMALHDTFKAAAFGHADGIDIIAGSKKRRADDSPVSLLWRNREIP